MKEEPEVAVTVVTAPPIWRSRLIQVLQIIGIIASLLGTANVLEMISALSPQAAAWLALSGGALRFGVEPIVHLIGDIVDDGKINKSFKVQDITKQ